MEEKVVKGSCLCGAVKYELKPPFIFFQYCHCSRCRKFTGSAFGANLFLKIKQFKWTAGESFVKRYELPDAQYFSTGFCETCGSSLPWVSRNGKYVMVPAGTLDDEPEMEPDRNIYWKSRANWCLSADEIPKFDDHP